MSRYCHHEVRVAKDKKLKQSIRIVNTHSK